MKLYFIAQFQNGRVTVITYPTESRIEVQKWLNQLSKGIDDIRICETT